MLESVVGYSVSTACWSQWLGTPLALYAGVSGWVLLLALHAGVSGWVLVSTACWSQWLGTLYRAMNVAKLLMWCIIHLCVFLPLQPGAMIEWGLEW